MQSVKRQQTLSITIVSTDAMHSSCLLISELGQRTTTHRSNEGATAEDKHQERQSSGVQPPHRPSHTRAAHGPPPGTAHSSQLAQLTVHTDTELCGTSSPRAGQRQTGTALDRRAPDGGRRTGSPARPAAATRGPTRAPAPPAGTPCWETGQWTVDIERTQTSGCSIDRDFLKGFLGSVSYRHFECLLLRFATIGSRYSKELDLVPSDGRD